MVFQKKKKPNEPPVADYMPLGKSDLKFSVEVPVRHIDESSLITIEKAGKMKSMGRLKSRSMEEETLDYGVEREEKGDYTLIITEKPQAALKIASALGKARKLNDGGAPYYELERGGKKSIVACAVGHLFGLTSKEKGFPVFSMEWEHSSKKNVWTKKYYNALVRLARRAKDFIVATDYDIEGEVIGWNIVRFIAKQKDARRMKFSTLTSPELQKAYENLLPTIDWGQAIAGETRHFLDWMYGINLSRALMSAIKKAGSFKIMSIGRVQGPALKLIVDKELEIQKFKSEPYWQVFIKLKGHKTELKYEKDIFDKKLIEGFKNLKGKKGIANTKKEMRNVSPPFPFDLTSLQRESYRLFGINPAKTLQIAQQLYLSGVISYPRTSSQKIPDAIEPRKILSRLKNRFKETEYAKRIKPIEGGKSDPAHPSIYPTGEFMELGGDELKLYTLIAKRFISCFCEDAVVEDKNIEFVTDGKRFLAKGLGIKEKGWMNVYPSPTKEVEVEDINGEKIISEEKIEEKETQPPRRYTPASIITELEKRDLGTKCLTGDTKVIFNGQFIPIKDLFNSGKNSIHKEDVEIRQIKGKTVSLNNKNNVAVSNPEFVSRRKLKNGEIVFRLETDNSTIALTENHLVYIYKDKEIKQVSARDLDINDKLIGVFRNFKEGGVIIDRRLFDSKFKIQNDEIVHKFSSKKSRGIKLDFLPVKWSNSLAWTLGYFYGDGSYCSPKYNGSHQISFTTTENKALNLLRDNIKIVFGVEPYYYNLEGKYKVDCNSLISYALIKAFPNLEGKIPVDIPQEFIGDFLRGFFDADGNVHLRPLGKTKIIGKECNCFDTPRIKLTLANERLIKWVSFLLREIGIDNHINKGIAVCKDKRFDCWTIFVSGKEKVERFAYKVGFDSYKEDILYKGLRCNSPFYEVLRNSARIYSALYKHELNPEELTEKIGISRYLVMRAIKHLLFQGFLFKRRIGRGSRQKWFYSIKKNLEYQIYCNKLLHKKIDNCLYGLPIRKIEKIDYNGYVYDISVEKDSPNFVTEGNLLVHNSTRANIIETLYDRNYVKGQSIEATPLGISLIKTLEKYSPIIIDEELTRNFEKEMEGMQEAKKDQLALEDKTLKEARETIEKISKDFKTKEEKIGKELLEATRENYAREREENTLGLCPNCKKGSLRIIFNRKSRRFFIGCSAYPECKTTFSLPPNGLMKSAGKTCEMCGFPKMLAIRKGNRPWEFCFNPACKSNEEWRARAQEKINNSNGERAGEEKKKQEMQDET